jgi:hypothetical protein
MTRKHERETVYLLNHIHTHTHTYIYIYIYIYKCVCVCVCMCVQELDIKCRDMFLQQHEDSVKMYRYLFQVGLF